ncbi:MAG: hypothetical protein RIQ53_263 [Pseudomonadota bacterium]|jgi:glycosyltransferase involved in cell wall biosynthesis
MSAAPLRVAYLVNQYPKVSHTFIRREILALERAGVEVHRLAMRGWDAPTPDADDAAELQRTHHLLRGGLLPLLWATLRVAAAAPRRWLSALACTLRMGWRADRPAPVHLIYLAEACAALLWMRARGVQHVHAHFGTNSTAVALLLRRLGGPPYSFTVHGPEEFDKPEFLHLGEKMREAAFTVAITAYCRSQLMRWVDATHWPRIAIAHCALEPTFHQGPAVAPVGRQLLCIGRLSEQKGHLLLIEAAGRLAQRGIDFNLVLAGDGELRAPIEARIAELGLAARVRITGWIGSHTVRELLLQSRALVLASFAEGLPVVLMEALALRRPVVTTWVNGIPELVEPGVCGWTCAPGDVDALADAMQACLQADEARLARMGEAGRERVLAAHDADIEARRLHVLMQASAGGDDLAAVVAAMPLQTRKVD